MADITGFVGLGAMGAPMALCLLKAGIPLVVYDRDRSRTRQLCSHGAEEAMNPAEVARRSARSISMVETTAQVRKVLLGADGIAAGASNGHHAACMSTVDRSAIRAMAADLDRHGITVVDAPVSGATQRAAAGKLTIFVGADGKSQPFSDCFAAMAEHVFYMGSLGKGLEMKLLNNMLAQVNSVAVAETMALASQAGMDLRTVIDAISVSTGNSAVFEMRVPRILERNFAPGGTIDISYKDQELETTFAKELGVPVFLANVTQQVYQIARGMGFGKEDPACLIKVYEAFNASRKSPVTEPSPD